MTEIKCPKCGSINVQKQASYAAIKDEGESARPSHVVPNECREINCGYKWFDED